MDFTNPVRNADWPDPDVLAVVSPRRVMKGAFITHSARKGSFIAPVPSAAPRRLVDPCPLWDDDGRAYLARGRARGRGGIAAPLGAPGSEDHVVFGTMSVGLVGSEEVAA